LLVLLCVLEKTVRRYFITGKNTVQAATGMVTAWIFCKILRIPVKKTVGKGKNNKNFSCKD